jgi:saccharopine dehydrogenase (NAD+, L-glutamate forming)
MTPRRFINSFLPYYPSKSVEEKFKEFLGPERIQLFDQFNWLGIFNNEEFIGLENASPAKLLEEFLIKKLVLSPNDKDMIVMYHEFEYSIDKKKKKVIASMVNIGEDPVFTSMSNTVGLPVAIMAKLILQEKFNIPGVHIPIQPEVYTPIMEELKSFGILFHEVENDL